MPETLQPTMEERLALLEKEVASVKSQLEHLTNSQGNWFERASGSLSHLGPDVWAEYKKIMEELDQGDRGANGQAD